MNGTLAALAEQAGYFIRFERTGQDVTVVYTKEPGTAGDLALFGELIVRQCGTFTDPVTRNLMMKHFGVEE